MTLQLTKYTHSCVAITDGDRKLVVDPGGFSETAAALDGATAVLVTHEHPDHLDVDAVRAALSADDGLTLRAPESVAGQFREFGDRVLVAEPGATFDAAGFPVRTFGGQHAVIHPRIPVIANVGYLIADSVFHPGDSFIVPEATVGTLLMPVSAPWAKLSEVIDFAIAVRAPRTVPVHEVIYSEAGRGMADSMVERFVGGFGSEYTPLTPGTTIDVSG